jgi:hypothetical protein
MQKYLKKYCILLYCIVYLYQGKAITIKNGGNKMKNLNGLFAFIKTEKGDFKGKIARAYNHRIYIEIEGMQHGFKVSSLKSMKVCFKNGIVQYI